MFISGLGQSGTSSDANGKLNNISASETVIIFDSIENYNLSLSNEKSSFPIESRSSISDHVFSPDGKFSFVGRVTSSPIIVRQQVEWDKNTDPNNPKAAQRIKTAFEVIKSARDSKSLISLSTEEFDLTNYVITGFDFNKDGPSELGIFNITLEEFRIRTVGTTVLATNVGVDAGASNQNKGSTQDANGNKQRGEVVETKNRNAKNTEFFLNKCAEGRQEYCQLVPAGTESDKFTLGLNK